MPSQDVTFHSMIKARGEDPETVLRSDRFRAEILLKDLAKKVYGGDGFRGFYDAHRADFDVRFGRRVRLASIFLRAAPKKTAQVPRTWAEATQELDRLKDRLGSDPASLAASFASQARIRSEDGAAAKTGGDLGFCGLRELEARGLSDSLLDAKSGTMVGPMNAREGVHLLLVGEKKSASPFEEIRDEVEKAARAELLRELKKDVPIERKI
jgi:hypothetical protein